MPNEAGIDLLLGDDYYRQEQPLVLEIKDTVFCTWTQIINIDDSFDVLALFGNETYFMNLVGRGNPGRFWVLHMTH